MSAIEDEYQKYDFLPYMYEDLARYLEAKEEYLIDREDTTDFKFWYDVCYTDLKQQWVISRISEKKIQKNGGNAKGGAVNAKGGGEIGQWKVLTNSKM